MKPRAIDPTISAHYVGDCRTLLLQLPAGCAQTCITSPPYWGLRDYGCTGQTGLEPTPEAYVETMVKVFREVWRVLADDGTLWLNLGDSFTGDPGGFHGKNNRSSRRAGKLPRASSRTFANKTNFKKRGAGLKVKDLVGIPWMTAFALRAAGWYLRSDIIWHKPNPMPESVIDRPTRAHEYIFLFAKRERYYYNADAIREPLQPKTLTTYNCLRKSKGTDDLGKIASHNWSQDVPTRTPNFASDGSILGASKRSVWIVGAQPYAGAHFATFPAALIEPCVLAGSRPGDLVIDPFFGSGTTGEVAEKHERRWIGFDVNPAYADLAKARTAQRSLPLARKTT